MGVLDVGPLTWQGLLCCFLSGAIVGVTSASAIWVLAAIGVVIGLGFSWLGVKLAVLTVIVLVGVDLLETQFESLQRGVHRKTPSPHGPAEGPRARSTQDSE